MKFGQKCGNLGKIWKLKKMEIQGKNWKFGKIWKVGKNLEIQM